MRRKNNQTTTPIGGYTAPLDLDLYEEDAYAHLVVVANDNATDSDKRKLIKAGILPTTDSDKTPPTLPIHKNHQSMSETVAKPPPTLPQSSRVRASAIRFILARANGVTFRKAINDAGVEWFDIQRFRWANPQFAVVQDFVEREKVHLIAAKASDALESLIDGDKTAETRNAKSVMFALERLKRDQFSDPNKSDSDKGSGKGGGIVYNITFQNVSQPNLCGGCVGKSVDSQIIDVECAK